MECACSMGVLLPPKGVKIGSCGGHRKPPWTLQYSVTLPNKLDSFVLNSVGVRRQLGKTSTDFLQGSVDGNEAEKHPDHENAQVSLRQPPAAAPSYSFPREKHLSSATSSTGTVYEGESSIKQHESQAASTSSSPEGLGVLTARGDSRSDDSRQPTAIPPGH